MPAALSVVVFVLLGAFVVLMSASLFTSTRRPGDRPAEQRPPAATTPPDGDHRAGGPDFRAGALAIAEGGTQPTSARRRISARRRRAEAAQQAGHVRDLSAGADRARVTGESQP
jgi:hypothetical protein